ncbi:hypothetical protein KL921_004458 [Ogataea angusta]|nr:hypothetical protein KL921_004458 [Ogataea angusta]
MAGASDKKQAAANSSILRQLHLASVVVNVLALLALFLLHRPAAKKYYFIFSLPGLGCQYVLEKVGRPKYHTNPQGYSVLSSAGQDLQQQGLTEYMIDIVYLTLIIDVLMILFGSNKVWLLLLAVPAYAGYKLKGFIAPPAVEPFTVHTLFEKPGITATTVDNARVQTRSGRGVQMLCVIFPDVTLRARKAPSGGREYSNQQAPADRLHLVELSSQFL